MELFTKKNTIDFSNKTDAQILKLFNSLNKEKQDEILDFLGKQLVIIPIVARQKGLSVSKMNIANRKDKTLLEKFYGITTYDQMKHVYDVIRKQ